MAETPPQDASDLLETAPQILALKAQAALIESLRAGRQLSDIPLWDYFWTASANYIILDTADENL